MRTFSKILSVVLSILILISALIPAYADTIDNTEPDSVSEMTSTTESASEPGKNVSDNKTDNLNQTSDKTDETIDKKTDETTSYSPVSKSKEKKLIGAELSNVADHAIEKQIEYSGDNFADVYDSSNNALSGSATYYRFKGVSTTKKTKFNYVSGKDKKGNAIYAAKLAKIIIKVDSVTVTWICNGDSLKNNNSDGYNTDLGDVTIDKTGSSGSLPKYGWISRKPSYNNTTLKKRWGPWEAGRATYDTKDKPKANKEFTAALSHNLIKSLSFTSKIETIPESEFQNFCSSSSSSKFPVNFSSATTTFKEDCFRTTGINSINWGGGGKTFYGGSFAFNEYIKTVDFGTYKANTLKNAVLADNKSIDTSAVGDFGYGVFQGCTNLTKIALGKTTVVPIKAFYGNKKINYLDIANVTEIRRYAFGDCNFEYSGQKDTLCIQANQNINIWSKAFASCDFKTLTYAGNVTLTGGNVTHEYGKSSAVPGQWENTDPCSGNSEIFSNCQNFTTLDLVNDGKCNISTITWRSFYNCNYLQTIKFSGNIKSIQREAFYDCDSLIGGTTLGTYGPGVTSTSIYGKALSDIGGKDHILCLPTSLSQYGLGHGSFRNCVKLRAVHWGNPNYVKVKSILPATFMNCVNIHFFVLPNSIERIAGTYESDPEHGTNHGQDFGAFYMDQNHCSDVENGKRLTYNYFDASQKKNVSVVNNINHNFFFAVNQNGESNLTQIGDKAFERYAAFPNNVGLKFYTYNNNTGSGAELGDTSILYFKNLKYVGERAFRNNPTLTGILQFGKVGGTAIYPQISSRAFANTNITDLFFRWDPTMELTASKVNTMSAQVGSSNTFISNNTTKGYTNSSAAGLIPSGFTSLYTLINGAGAVISNDDVSVSEDGNGLIQLWRNAFSKLSFNSNYTEWKSFYGYISSDTLSKTQPNYVWEKDTGKNQDSGDNVAHPNNPRGVNSADKESRSYLFAQTNWKAGQEGKTAQEQITFGYKNRQNYDFIFVVDNSPSMDDAAHTKDSNVDDISENQGSYSGAKNASKMMNAYSVIYDFSEKALNTQTGAKNTVSVISFTGNRENRIVSSGPDSTAANTTKTIAYNLRTKSELYKALFKNDNHYEDGGTTSFSSGLNRAYQSIKDIRNYHANNSEGTYKQIVIMVTDGKPTYWDGNKAVTANTTNALSYQANGIDWAAAIRNDTEIDNKLGSAAENGHTICTSAGNANTPGSFSVHAFNSSLTGNQSPTYSVVEGLGAEMYGLLIGSKSTSAAYTYLSKTVEGEKKSTYSSNNTFASESFSKITQKLAEWVGKWTSQNYTVVIPFDNNFKPSDINGSYYIKATQIDDSGNEIDSEKTIEISQRGTFTNVEGYGRFAYSQSKNAFIWDLSSVVVSEDKDVIVQGNPYTTYNLFFELEYKSKANGATVTLNNERYVAVNDNSKTTSSNGIYESDKTKSAIKNRTNEIASNGASSNSITGVYAYITTDDTYGSTTTYNGEYSNENNGTLMNYTRALFLKLSGGDVILQKLSSDANNTNNLSGAKFQVYDSNYNLLTWAGSATEVHIDATKSTVNLTTGTSPFTMKNLPAGIYYLYESKYPEDANYLYSQDYTKLIGGTYVDVDLHNDKRTYKMIKVSINPGDTKTVTVYNYPGKKEENLGYISGQKLYQKLKSFIPTDELRWQKNGISDSTGKNIVDNYWVRSDYVDTSSSNASDIELTTDSEIKESVSFVIYYYDKNKNYIGSYGTNASPYIVSPTAAVDQKISLSYISDTKAAYIRIAIKEESAINNISEATNGVYLYFHYKDYWEVPMNGATIGLYENQSDAESRSNNYLATSVSGEFSRNDSSYPEVANKEGRFGFNIPKKQFSAPTWTKGKLNSSGNVETSTNNQWWVSPTYSTSDYGCIRIENGNNNLRYNIYWYDQYGYIGRTDDIDIPTANTTLNNMKYSQYAETFRIQVYCPASTTSASINSSLKFFGLKSSFYVVELNAPDNSMTIDQNVYQVDIYNYSGYNAAVSGDGFIDYSGGQIRIKVDSIDDVKEGFNVRLIGNKGLYSSSSTSYTGVTDKNGEVTFNVPIYYCGGNAKLGKDSMYYGNSVVDEGIYYKVEITGLNGANIPCNYCSPIYTPDYIGKVLKDRIQNSEYTPVDTSSGQEVDLSNSAMYSYYQQDRNNIVTSDYILFCNYSHSSYAGAHNAFSGQENPCRELSVYYPSIKLQIDDFDIIDKPNNTRTTPLSADFKLESDYSYNDTPLNGETILSNVGWSQGKIDNSGNLVADSSNRYYKTGRMDVSSYDYLSVELSDDSDFRGYIYLYDSSGELISSNRYTSSMSIPVNAKYARISVFRSGTEEFVSGSLVSKVNPEMIIKGINGIMKTSTSTSQTSNELNVEWERGRFKYTTGEEVEETSGRYYRSGYIDVSEMDSINFSIGDNTYRYNIYWYDKDKNFVSIMENKNPPITNTSGKYSVPDNAEYARLLICRSGNLGGVNEEHLYISDTELSSQNNDNNINLYSDWNTGKLDPETGLIVSDTSKLHYYSGKIDISDYESISVSSIDSTYMYNVYMYDEHDNLIEVLDNIEIPSRSDDYTITDSNAKYIRIYAYHSTAAEASVYNTNEMISVVGKSKEYYERLLTKEKLSWEKGNINTTTGENISSNTGAYWTSSYVSLNDTNGINVNVEQDNPYGYAVFWYSGDMANGYNYISYEPFSKSSKKLTPPNNATYARILLAKNSSPNNYTGEVIDESELFTTAPEFSVIANALNKKPISFESIVSNSSFTQWYGERPTYLMLTQTKVQDDYSLLTKPVRVLMKTGLETKYTDDGKLYYLKKVTVYNGKKSDFPYAGGKGTSTLFIVGSGLLLIAAYIFVRKKTNRKGFLD